MKKMSFHRMLLLATGFWFAGTAYQAMAASPAPVVQAVGTALSDLDIWLQVDANGKDWQSFLRNDDLKKQVELGPKADRVVVGEILQRYTSGKPGLDLPKFAAVRQGLRNWVTELSFTSTVAPQSIREQATVYQPITAETVAAAKKELLEAIAALEASLNAGGPASAAGWKTFLRWDEMVAQVNKAEAPDMKVIDLVLEKFHADAAGNELPQFTRVRRALRTYSDVATISADPKAAERYAAAVEELSKHLEGYGQTRGTSDLLGISHSLVLLKRMRQSEALVKSVGSQFQQPNLYATVSQRLLHAAMAEEIERTQAVSDNILGTSLEGTATLKGKTSVYIVPCADSAKLEIVLLGNIFSENNGRNGPVSIYSTANTSIQAHKVLCMSANGMCENPSIAAASTCSTIHDICARCGLIEKFAWKQADATKPKAEAIASGKAAARVQEQVDSQSATQVAELNQQYQDKFIAPMKRRDLFTDSLKFSSTQGLLHVSAVQAKDGQISAPDVPPASNPAQDVAVRLHESLIGNVSETILGGMLLTDERLVQIIRDELKAEVPEELQITPEKDPWSITFAREAPVRATFSGGLVRIAIRGRRFSRGDQAINELAEISATYKVEPTATGSKLVRQGDVEVLFVGRDKLGAQQIAFRTFLRRKFEAMFKPEFVSEGLQLKGRLEKAGKLLLSDVQSEAGWISLGWKLAAKPAPAPAATATASSK
ncbi:MAG: hypothetical protein ACO1RA_00965 [Planctomycetaceae bacterium]